MAQGVQVVSMAQGVQVVDISQKVNVIITNYKNGKTNISLPRNPKLENDLNIILVKVRKEISSATPETIKDLKLTVSQYLMQILIHAYKIGMHAITKNRFG